MTFAVAAPAHAKLREPDNIIYGILPRVNNSISLEINGEMIANTTFGNTSEEEQNFALRVPIDSLDPQEPGTARPGNVALIYLDWETTPVATVIIGKRGTTQLLFIPGAENDIDQDGWKDGNDNCPDVANADQDDANNNGIGDACDESDTDGDGYSDKLEYMYILSGKLDPDGHAYDLFIVNSPGDTGYILPGDEDNFWLLMLPVILNAASQQ